MSTHIPSRRGAHRRRNVQCLNQMAEQPRPNGRPCPRDVFMLWLMLLPDDANLAAAAQKEIARIEAARVSSRDTDELKKLFQQAAE